MASTPRVQPITDSRQVGVALLIAYLMVYASMLFGMHHGNFNVAEPLLVFTIVGFGFSLSAWLFTIGIHPLAYSILKPKRELTVIGAYLILLIAFLTWGLQALNRYISSGPGNAIAILLAKLLILVVLPAAIMRIQFGYRLRQLIPMSVQTRHSLVIVGMSILLLTIQAVLGRGLRDILSAHPPAIALWLGFPITFFWLALEAGVVEEFFFRVLLQTRLSAVLNSELGAIVLTSLIFGLAHAPGLYLRTALTQEGLSPHPSLFMATGYSIVVISVAGFFLGVLWTRSRNFAVVVVVHAMGDVLPNLLPTLHSLRLFR